MIEFVAPTQLPIKDRSPESVLSHLFLAGGITGCSDWQEEFVSALHLVDLPNLRILNPRRESFDVTAKNINVEQIYWEHEALCYADAILFWFTPETVCPITLYELGTWSMTSKPLFMGCHPEYARKEDVVVQTRLKRPEIVVMDSLQKLQEQVVEWIKERETA